MIRRIRFVAFATGLALLAASGLAFAATDDADDSEPSGAFFTYGYDPANHLLVTGIHPVGSVDCTIDGSYEVGYGASEGGTIPVATVSGDEGPVVFPVEADEEDDDVAGLSYDDDGNPCTLEAILVSGPNGQVNHGTVVSAFSRALDLAGKGCVMRWIAKSGFGKGDQQIRTPDVDPTFVVMDTGSIDLVTVMAACRDASGGGDDDDGNAEVDEGGKPARIDDLKPDKASKAKPGKPESPGNSANAPGRNK